MFYYGLLCAGVGLVAGLLHFAEGSLMALHMSGILFLIGVGLVVIDVVWKRAAPMT